MDDIMNGGGGNASNAAISPDEMKSIIGGGGDGITAKNGGNSLLTKSTDGKQINNTTTTTSAAVTSPNKVEHMDDQEPEYAVVAERLDESAERIELPINDQDKTLGLTTLTHAFPGAHGLKYRNPATGALRGLLMDPNGTKFLPPPGGWTGKTFIVIFPNAMQGAKVPPVAEQTPKQHPSSPAGGGGKRRKLMARDSAGEATGGKGSNIAEHDDDSSGGEDEHSGSEPRRSTLSSSNKKRLVSSSGDPESGSKTSLKKQKSQSKADEDDENGSEEGGGGDGQNAVLDQVTDLIVLGLPWTLTIEQFRGHFEKFGKVSHAEIKKTSSGASKGFGFVQMSTIEEQAQVLRDPVHTIEGRDCQVRVPFTQAQKAGPPLSNKVFVGRITDQTTHEELKEFFTEEAKQIEENASVTDVYIPRPFRAFAFITFSSPAVARAIIIKKNFKMGELELAASNANPRIVQQQQQPGGYPPQPQQQQYGMGAGNVYYSPQPGFKQPRAPIVTASGGVRGPNRGRPPPAYFEEAYQQRRGDWPVYEAPGAKSPYIPPPEGMYGGNNGGGGGQLADYGYATSQQQFGGGGGGRSPHPHQPPPPPVIPGGGNLPGGGGYFQNQQQLPTAQLETLNLNNMNPEVMSAALKAFFTAAANAAASQLGGGGGVPAADVASPPPGYPPAPQQQQPAQYRGGGGGHRGGQQLRGGGGNSPAHYGGGRGGGSGASGSNAPSWR